MERNGTSSVLAVTFTFRHVMSCHVILKRNETYIDDLGSVRNTRC